MVDYPFYDKQPGPERREKLNEMYEVWTNALGNVIKGDSGWSPLIRAVTHLDRVVLELYDWTGGQGSKPTTTGYLGSTGYVSDISLAIDFRGPMGLTGDAASVSVGTVTTTAPGTNATVSNTGTPNNAVFDFEIPRGDTGLKGDKGDTGDSATISVGTVTTGAPGTNAQVVNVGTSSSAIFDFTIPRGADGSGTGDMLKSEYDSVGDGVVNEARAVPWTGITDKPAVIAAGADAASARLVIDAASTAELTAGLNNKVDKVVGKGLSTEDFTTADKTKLSGIAEGATANQADSFLLNRANHTGGQSISTITGLQTSLDNKVNSTNGTASGIALNGGYTEQVFNLTGTVISPSNGSIQTKTLSANTTFTETLSNGQSVILGITAGAFSVTWPTMLWTKVGGSGTMPSLTSSGVNWVVLWKVDSTLRGNFLGTA